MKRYRAAQIILIALRSVYRFRLRNGLTLFATAIGVAGLIASSAYSVGARQKIEDQMRKMGTNLIIVTPEQSKAVGGRARTGTIVTTLVESDYDAMRRSVFSITQSSATVSGIFRVKAGDLSRNTTVIGCEPAFFSIKNWSLENGDGFTRGDDRRMARVVVLGSTVALELFPGQDAVGQRITINRIPFEVSGVLRERGQSLDVSNEDEQVYVPLRTEMLRLMNVNYLSSILLQVRSWKEMTSVTSEVKNLFGRRHKRFDRAVDDFHVQSQKSLLETQMATTNQLTFLMRGIASSVLLLSAIGVFAIFMITIRNRASQIATHRALGANVADIVLQLLTESIIPCVCGCILGLVAGCVTSLHFSQSFVMNGKQAIAYSTLSFGLYAIAAVIPCLSLLRGRKLNFS